MYLERRNNIFEMTLAVITECERLQCVDHEQAVRALVEALKAGEKCDLVRAITAHEKLVDCYRKPLPAETGSRRVPGGL